MYDHSDVSIVGGGPVGSALALALAQLSPQLRVQVLEARMNISHSAGQRTLALSYGSRLILDRLGVWQGLCKVTPIRHIHISQRGSVGLAQLHASEERVPELGYVVDYAELDVALHRVLADSSVKVITGAHVSASGSTAQYAWIKLAQDGKQRLLTTCLAAIADGGGGQSKRETRDYDQHALLAWVGCTAPQANWAFERFTAQGPAALLPHGEGYALVWTDSPERVEQMLSMQDTEFLSALQCHIGDRVGRFNAVSGRSSYPLTQSRVQEAVQAHRVMIGNAAHVMHPVAGQGFNLGLRDAWELALHIHDSNNAELGSLAMLQQFAAQRKLDVSASMWFTDRLVRVFTHAHPLLQHVRGAGLMALQQLPPLKHFIARRMMFGAQAW